MSLRSSTAALACLLCTTTAPSARAAGLFIDRFIEEDTAISNDDPTPGPPVWRIVQVASSALPRESLPAPFEKPERPMLVAPETSWPELRIVEDPQRNVKSFPPNPLVHVKIEMVAKRGGGNFLSSGATREAAQDWRSSWTASCTPGGHLFGIRLETLLFNREGRATLEIEDGLFDQDTCALGMQRKTTLHPAVLLSEGTLPLVFGVRTDEGLLLLFPPAAMLDADALGVAVPVQSRTGSHDRGPFRSVLLPVAKGSAATAFATVFPSVVQSWYAAQTGAAAQASLSPKQVMTIAVDVVQTTTDENPTILVRTTKDTQESRRPPTIRDPLFKRQLPVKL